MVRERVWDTKGPGSTLDGFIFLFNRNTLNNRSSVLKMAGIVYEGRFTSPVLS